MIEKGTVASHKFMRCCYTHTHTNTYAHTPHTHHTQMKVLTEITDHKELAVSWDCQEGKNSIGQGRAL